MITPPALVISFLRSIRVTLTLTYFHSEGLDGVTAEAIPNHMESIVIDIIGQFCTNSRLS